MSPLFFALGFALMALLVYMGRYSGRVRAEASRFIAAPPERVQALVDELSRWQPWNPWLEHARDTPARVDGPLLSWDVPQVGRGSVRQLGGARAGQSRQQVVFALPFAVRGRSEWRFEPAPGGTQVVWRLRGRVAFTLRAFAATVQGATALDLRFGLDCLAASLEAQPPAYRLGYLGVQPQPERRHAQQLHRGSLDTLATELPPLMREVRERLAAAGAVPRAGVVHYLKTQLRLRTVDCRVGVELPGPQALPDGLALHVQPAHAAYVLHFEGRPQDLELAWYQAMQRLRVLERQPHPQLPPYARYHAEPAPGEPTIADLHLPLKA